MKKKLSLTELKIKSFVTAVKTDYVRGGQSAGCPGEPTSATDPTSTSIGDNLVKLSN